MAVSQQSKGRIGAGGLDLPGMQVRTLRVPLNATADAGVVSTGAKIPPKSQVLNVLVDIKADPTAGTTGLTLNVGTTAATQGFALGVAIASAGIKQTSMASGNVTRGSLLREFGSVASVLLPAPHITDAEIEVAYNTNVAISALKGDVVIEYRKLGD
jgi:hypothetical protein